MGYVRSHMMSRRSLIIAVFAPALVCFSLSAFAGSGDLPRKWKQWETSDGRVYYQRPDGSTTWDRPQSSDSQPSSSDSSYSDSSSSSSYSSGDRSGFFTGLGPQVGFEMNDIRALTYGAATQTGFRFNERYTVLVELDMIFTSKDGSNFLLIPFTPTFKWNFHKGFFASAGVGYVFFRASTSIRLGGLSFSGSANRHGFGGLAAGGYDFLFGDRFSLSPQVGMDYTRVAGGNILLPNMRVVAKYHF
jgi:hypothetical protein